MPYKNPVFSTLQRPKRKQNYNRRQHKRTAGHALAKTKTGELIPIGFASRFLSDTEKKYAINDLKLLKLLKLLRDHQALEPLIKRNRSNKT